MSFLAHMPSALGGKKRREKKGRGEKKRRRKGAKGNGALGAAEGAAQGQAPTKTELRSRVVRMGTKQNVLQ